MLYCTSSIDTTFQAPVVGDKNRRQSQLWEIERPALVVRNVFGCLLFEDDKAQWLK